MPPADVLPASPPLTASFLAKRCGSEQLKLLLLAFNEEDIRLEAEKFHKKIKNLKGDVPFFWSLVNATNLHYKDSTKPFQGSMPCFFFNWDRMCKSKTDATHVTNSHYCFLCWEPHPLIGGDLSGAPLDGSCQGWMNLKKAFDVFRETLNVPSSELWAMFRASEDAGKRTLRSSVIRSPAILEVSANDLAAYFLDDGPLRRLILASRDRGTCQVAADQFKRHENAYSGSPWLFSLVWATNQETSRFRMDGCAARRSPCLFYNLKKCKHDSENGEAHVTAYHHCILCGAADHPLVDTNLLHPVQRGCCPIIRSLRDEFIALCNGTGADPQNIWEVLFGGVAEDEGDGTRLVRIEADAQPKRTSSTVEGATPSWSSVIGTEPAVQATATVQALDTNAPTPLAPAPAMPSPSPSRPPTRNRQIVVAHHGKMSGEQFFQQFVKTHSLLSTLWKRREEGFRLDAKSYMEKYWLTAAPSFNDFVENRKQCLLEWVLLFWQDRSSGEELWKTCPFFNANSCINTDKGHRESCHRCLVCGGDGHAAGGTLSEPAPQGIECELLTKYRNSLIRLARKIGHADHSELLTFFGFGDVAPPEHIKISDERRDPGTPPPATPASPEAAADRAPRESILLPEPSVGAEVPVASIESELPDSPAGSHRKQPDGWPTVFLEKVQEAARVTGHTNGRIHLFPDGVNVPYVAGDERLAWCECEHCSISKKFSRCLHPVCKGYWFPTYKPSSREATLAKMRIREAVVKRFGPGEDERELWRQEVRAFQVLPSDVCVPMLIKGSYCPADSNGEFILATAERERDLMQHLQVDRDADRGLHNSLELARRITRLVAAAHRCEIRHGDLKPMNILIHQNENCPPSVELCDFESAFDPDFNQTQVQRMEVFTPWWQCRNPFGSPIELPDWDKNPVLKGCGSKDVARRCLEDLWSLGMILYEVLRSPTLTDPSVPKSKPENQQDVPWLVLDQWPNVRRTVGNPSEVPNPEEWFMYLRTCAWAVDIADDEDSKHILASCSNRRDAVVGALYVGKCVDSITAAFSEAVAETVDETGRSPQACASIMATLCTECVPKHTGKADLLACVVETWERSNGVTLGSQQPATKMQRPPFVHAALWDLVGRLLNTTMGAASAQLHPTLLSPTEITHLLNTIRQHCSDYSREMEKKDENRYKDANDKLLQGYRPHGIFTKEQENYPGMWVVREALFNAKVDDTFGRWGDFSPASGNANMANILRMIRNSLEHPSDFVLDDPVEIVWSNQPHNGVPAGYTEKLLVFLSRLFCDGERHVVVKRRVNEAGIETFAKDYVRIKLAYHAVSLRLQIVQMAVPRTISHSLHDGE